MSKVYHKHDNFVPALRDPQPHIIEVETPRDLPAPPPTVLLPQAGYKDRSIGFSIATGPLAAATGFVVLLIGITAFGVPVLSVAALLLALAGFTVAWLIAYIVHTIVSPDGSTFAHVVLTWAYLGREQRERHKRYARLHEKQGNYDQ